MVRGAMLLGLALAMTACSGRAGGDEAVVDPLAPSLQVRVEGDSVVFDLFVTNVSGEPVRLEFSTSQRADFVVERATGERVWAWSDDRMFAQVLGEETVEPGETLHYGAVWNPPTSLSGRYSARGVLSARDRRIELSREFELP